MSEATESSGADSIDSSAIRNALEREDYDTVIVEVRAAMTADPVAALADPVINDWLGRRFRNIFIDEAMDDPEAVKAGEAMFPLNLIDQRDQRQKVAERMIRNIDPDEVHVEMPKPQIGSLNNTTFVFAPGLLTGLLPSLAFQSVWPLMKERFGVRIIAADAHPVRPAEKNVVDLENTIERGIGVDSDPEGSFITAEDNPTPPGDVLLMGYSKGSPDILSLLVARPDLAPRIKGVIGWAGAVGGSYAADDIYETIKDMPLFGEAAELSGVVTKQLLRLAPITQLSHVDRRIEEYDARGAIKTLTTWYRSKFNEDNKDLLNSLGIPMFHFTGSTSILEVPYFQKQGVMQLDEYDQYNDMQVTQAQASMPLPGAPRLAMFHANHWDLSYDRFPWYTTMGSQHLKQPFTRKAAIASIIQFMAEIGLLD